MTIPHQARDRVSTAVAGTDISAEQWEVMTEAERAVATIIGAVRCGEFEPDNDTHLVRGLTAAAHGAIAEPRGTGVDVAAEGTAEECGCGAEGQVLVLWRDAIERHIPMAGDGPRAVVLGAVTSPFPWEVLDLYVYCGRCGRFYLSCAGVRVRAGRRSRRRARIATALAARGWHLVKPVTGWQAPVPLFHVESIGEAFPR